jgi:hypothetical protein
MKSCEARDTTIRAGETSRPSEELRIAITFRPPGDRPGPTKLDARVSARGVMSLAPDPLDMDRALYELHARGFETTIRGRITASVRGTRRQFETLFKTRLARFVLPPEQLVQFRSFYYPPANAPWNAAGVSDLIDDAYIQWPHIYMAARRRAEPARPTRPRRRAAETAATTPPSPFPPTVKYFHLTVPNDTARLLNARPVHQAGTRGKGVRVVMVDSGFAHDHPFFVTNRFSSTVALAPGATNRKTDPNGHGTGESANIFSIAPEATFIGVKVDNDDNPQRGASLLEGFQEALRHKPQVISVSLGYDLRAADGVSPLKTLPRGLVALEAEIQAAVASGIVVVFSAGNGHYSFPGQMKEVISAGGVYVDAAGRMRASDYASAFKSAIYSGRSVPDYCGLVGLLPHADYIALPIPPGCEIDVENAAHDETTTSDGWGVFSGTSAAAPQLAAVCALLLEKNRSLTPADVKAVLKRTAKDVTTGRANPASDPKEKGLAASPGLDGATGAGLVDAFAAWKQV